MCCGSKVIIICGIHLKINTTQISIDHSHNRKGPMHRLRKSVLKFLGNSQEIYSQQKKWTCRQNQISNPLMSFILLLKKLAYENRIVTYSNYSALVTKDIGKLMEDLTREVKIKCMNDANRFCQSTDNPNMT